MPRQSWDSLRDWETEILSPCPLPPLEKKKKRQSWVCSGARAGQDLERIPLFWGCWTSRFLKIYIKSDKSSVIRRPPALFSNKCKNKQTNADADRWASDHLPDGYCVLCLGLGTCPKFRMGQEWKQTSGFLLFFLQTTRHQLPIIHAASWGIIRSGTKW